MKIDNSEPCYYCGAAANGQDHVIPKIILKSFQNDLTAIKAAPEIIRGRILTVPCCGQCNSILGAKYFKTLAERKAFLKVRLKQKNKKLLSMPDWTEEELSELGDRLREAVEAGIDAKNYILRRIRW